MSVRISPRALDDLFNIWTYIADDNEEEADKMADEFDRLFALIDENPQMGRTRDEIEKRLRSFPLRAYVIFYTHSEGGIVVIRVLHSRQDVEESFDT